MATKEREIETYDTSSFLQKNKSKVAMGAVGSFAYEAKHLIQTQPVQGLVKSEIFDEEKGISKKANKESRMQFSRKKLGTAMGKGHYAATVLDVGRRIGGYHDTEEIKGEQEFQLRKKMKKQREKNRNLYGNINQGEVVFNLFESRTGHHKMGNAKFN
ncbi:TPA: hypothetical protein QCS32_002198 [Bacillus thuringiensis]|uniref:Uncharacterized protein n=2 Tax=Bacillus cereus group TaxID=86661 RepID=A0AB34D6Y8_BACCE|nr:MULTISPECIES: hypothetical protein [Bacillus cereus group]HDR5350563.1 hypothetical protein [Bacillus thuringiensis]KAB2497557.1 hypothetical protein F8158_13620 [Bacillus cereus]MCH5456708.1 hypothetical protein [Bacillus cereus]MCU5644076.1 hypothetical protein [Bacillus cereus]MDA1971520.1 hypothetical protein [Bacillus cereus]